MVTFNSTSMLSNTYNSLIISLFDLALLTSHSVNVIIVASFSYRIFTCCMFHQAVCLLVQTQEFHFTCQGSDKSPNITIFLEMSRYWENTRKEPKENLNEQVGLKSPRSPLSYIK